MKGEGEAPPEAEIQVGRESTWEEFLFIIIIKKKRRNQIGEKCWKKKGGFFAGFWAFVGF